MEEGKLHRAYSVLIQGRVTSRQRWSYWVRVGLGGLRINWDIGKGPNVYKWHSSWILNSYYLTIELIVWLPMDFIQCKGQVAMHWPLRRCGHQLASSPVWQSSTPCTLQIPHRIEGWPQNRCLFNSKSRRRVSACPISLARTSIIVAVEFFKSIDGAYEYSKCYV